NVNANHLLAFLIDDRVDRYGGFACLAVTDDQFALTTSNWDHGINGFEAGLHRLVHRLTPNYPRCNFFNRLGALCSYRAFTVYRLPKRVDDPAHQFLAYRHFQDTAGTLDGIAFRNVLVRAHDYRANGVALKIECQTECIAGELQHLAVHHIGKTMDAHNAVCY